MTSALPAFWPPKRRDAERDRLNRLLHTSVALCDDLDRKSIAPLLVQAKEIRKYFACDGSETLDAIFSTLRDFLRALCESRDAQRRARRAVKRESDRKAAAKARRKSTSDLRHTLNPTPPAGAPPNVIGKGMNEPRPPPGPPDDLNRVDHMLTRARRQRAAVDGDHEEDDREHRLNTKDWVDD